MLGGRANDGCVSGLTSVDGKMIMLLDVNRLVDGSFDVELSPSSAPPGAPRANG
jgi:chemotaxis signal transduction protein